MIKIILTFLFFYVAAISGSSYDTVAPKIRILNRRLGAAIGGNVTLRCILQSNPKSVTYWTRGGGEMMILSNTKYNSFIVDTDINMVEMSLIISNMSPDDFGFYTCVAKNSVGETEGNITVYEKPEPVTVGLESNTNKMPPIIILPYKLVGAAIGSNVTLGCNLKSNPRSVVYWTRKGGGFMIISNAKYNSHLIDTGNQMEQMRLIIKNLGPDDFGSYTCVAKNSVAESEGSITLYEIPHPSTYPSSEELENNAAESDGQDTEVSLMWTTLSTIILRLLF